jgi:hypothetical protein
MNRIEFTTTKNEFLTNYIGKFDTPKKLNRSEQKLPSEFIDKIESGDITSIDLVSISAKYPVFYYKTCVTIHGNFPEITTSYIGGYKNIRQNANGSLEILHNAIDYEKKRKLAKLCKSFNWNRTSTQDYFSQTFATSNINEARQKLKELSDTWKERQIEGMSAKTSVIGYSYFGRYFIELIIKPYLIEGDIFNIASQLTGLTLSEIEAINLENIQEDQKRKEEREKSEQAAAARKEQEQEQIEKLQDQLKQRGLSVKKQGSEGKYIGITYTTQGYMFAQYDVKKAAFGRFKVNYKLSKTLAFEGEEKEFRKGKAVKFEEINSRGLYC